MASTSRLGSGGYGIRRRGSFAGKTTAGTETGIVADAFLSSLVRSTAIKKPGVPKGTPEWLKTTLEIVLGRRGNAVTVPSLQTLTFSATPTQAECEALYEYVNDIRSALEDLINRFDM
jgi:hypothetical protein